ncbi:hypothetical protein [Bradyrhizobium roseum]|uniref:hypothetical protein n=1 Tax=Bradyrhizobium roseum TaxID=3056648 RepID=UPI00261FE3B4|nr:hypothetical protein [Bradyrhizobium roseus]WKA25784.1 hypothetical protein QUH67_19335 [Bradyrhizobium roseus]
MRHYERSPDRRSGVRVANVDFEVLAMGYMIAAVVTLLAVVTPTSASGACKKMLRGELVQSPGRPLASPDKFLRFTLSEIVRGSEAKAGENLKDFQTFTVPNTITTLPIPFALNVDTPEDCPADLRLGVGTSHKDDRISFFTHGDVALTGAKRVDLDEFERIPVYGVRRSF